MPSCQQQLAIAQMEGNINNSRAGMTPPIVDTLVTSAGTVRTGCNNGQENSVKGVSESTTLHQTVAPSISNAENNKDPASGDTQQNRSASDTQEKT